MLDLNLIRSFVTVCEAGSVTVAARVLNQPKSTISRHLARLEEELDRQLLDRSRTGVALTSEGKRLFELTRDSIHLLEPLGRRAVGPARPAHVRVTAPRYYAQGPLSKVARDFMANNPDVTLQCTSQSRLSDTYDEQTDILISVGAGLNGEMDTRSLGTVAARLYASPALFEGQVPPEELAELSGYPFLSSCGVVGIPERLSLSNDRGRSVTIAPKTRLITNEMDLLLPAACDGLGMAVLPEFVGAEHVASGRLVALLPDYWTERFQVSIALLSAKRNRTARTFVDFAVQELSR